MEENYGLHNRLTLERRVTALPMNEVVISYRRTAIGPDIVIGTNGVRNQVYVSTDFPFERSSGPLPQYGQSAIFGSDWHWTVDRSATFDGVIDTAVGKVSHQNPEFLGASVKDTGDHGHVALQSSLTEPALSNVANLVQFTPLTFALAALVAFFCRAQGVWPPLGLALVTLPSLGSKPNQAIEVAFFV